MEEKEIASAHAKAVKNNGSHDIVVKMEGDRFNVKTLIGLMIFKLSSGSRFDMLKVAFQCVCYARKAMAEANKEG